MRLPAHADVLAAADRLGAHVEHTPALSNGNLDGLVGVPVFFKAENLQRAGAFKFRGAMNALLCLSDEARRPGVATHSSGNHGAALAMAGQLLGVPVQVVVPEGAPAFKLRNILRYGAQVVHCGASLASRESTLNQAVERTGATFVPPYNDFNVICGQGTAALEFVAQVPDLQTVFVPVGGGGLASGTLTAIGHTHRVIGAEPELADDAARSMQTGRIEPAREPRTLADGLRTSLGELTFAILYGHSLQIVVVSETEIVAAQELLIENLKMLIEPSSAVPFAALLKMVREGARPDAPIGVILSGGNVEPPASS
ncbi:MAG: pyridoxal-phosphate dependent enzyme [Proteobacteria bacterium]|nr:pyridoxal-phosphate dependent enzyme [Pseudomonadota bacterium]